MIGPRFAGNHVDDIPDYPSRSYQHNAGYRTVPWDDWVGMRQRAINFRAELAALRRQNIPLKLLAASAGFALIPTSMLSLFQTFEDWHGLTADDFRARYGREYDNEQILAIFRQAHASINEPLTRSTDRRE